MSLPYRRKSASRCLHRNFEAGFSRCRVKHGMVIVFLNTLQDKEALTKRTSRCRFGALVFARLTQG
jgi:hypothetical protein